VDERLAKMATIIAARGLDPTVIKSKIGYGEIVGRAAEFVDRTPGEAKAMWQILSGLTHGQLWASLAVTDYETLSMQITDRALNNRVTSSVAKYAGFCATACVWVGAAFELYARARRTSGLRVSHSRVPIGPVSQIAMNHPQRRCRALSIRALISSAVTATATAKITSPNQAGPVALISMRAARDRTASHVRGRVRG
jgi:hypothetical protein